MNGLNNEFIDFAAVICCADSKHDEIISNIIGLESLPASLILSENVIGYPWHVDTKYYTADIVLIALKEKNLISSDFADKLQAVIIHFDSANVNSLKEIESWFPFIEEFEPQVQLLICDNCSSENSTGLKRPEIIEWCLQKQFELVELNPDDTEDDEVEDDFKETKGYKRIIQALQAHSWSNLTMKEPPNFQPSEELLASIRNESLASVNPNAGAEINCSISDGSAVENEKSEGASGVDKRAEKETVNNKIDTLFDEDRWLFDALGKEDPEGESFEALFSKLLCMKEKALTLTGDERKLYAEKVTLEFWRALGGDEDEIAGLCDEEN